VGISLAVASQASVKLFFALDFISPVSKVAMSVKYSSDVHKMDSLATAFCPGSLLSSPLQ
jgi:hypothetical protein